MISPRTFCRILRAASYMLASPCGGIWAEIWVDSFKHDLDGSVSLGGPGLASLVTKVFCIGFRQCCRIVIGSISSHQILLWGLLHVYSFTLCLALLHGVVRSQQAHRHTCASHRFCCVRFLDEIWRVGRHSLLVHAWRAELIDPFRMIHKPASDHNVVHWSCIAATNSQ